MHISSAGQRVVLAVGGRDALGNTVMAGGAALQAHIKMHPHANKSSATKLLPAEVVDRRNGTYEVTHDMKVACDFEVCLILHVSVPPPVSEAAMRNQACQGLYIDYFQ